MVVNERIELKGDTLFIDDMALEKPKKLGRFWKYKIDNQDGVEAGILLFWDRVFWGEDYSDFEAYLYTYKSKKFFVLLELFSSKLAGDINLLTYEIPKIVKRKGDLLYFTVMFDGYKVPDDSKIFGDLQFVANDLFDAFAGKVIKLQVLREVFYNENKKMFKKFSNEVAPKIFFNSLKQDTKGTVLIDSLIKVVFGGGKDYTRRFIEIVKKCEDEIEKKTGIECINDYAGNKMDSVITRLSVYKVRNELRIIMWVVMGIFNEENLCGVIDKILTESKSPLTVVVYDNGELKIIPINEQLFNKPEGFIFSPFITDFKKIREVFNEITRLEKEVGHNE